MGFIAHLSCLVHGTSLSKGNNFLSMFLYLNKIKVTKKNKKSLQISIVPIMTSFDFNSGRAISGFKHNYTLLILNEYL